MDIETNEIDVLLDKIVMTETGYIMINLPLNFLFDKERIEFLFYEWTITMEKDCILFSGTLRHQNIIDYIYNKLHG